MQIISLLEEKLLWYHPDSEFQNTWETTLRRMDFSKDKL